MRIRRTVKERGIVKVWVSYDFGKRVKDLASLPEEVIKYIKIITT